MPTCPCGSTKKYTECCKPYHSYAQLPATPEDLMRSRYAAFTLAHMEYIKKTMRGLAAVGFEEEAVKKWAKKNIWLKLDVLSAYNENPERGYVEFIAQYIEGKFLHSMHEKSEFVLENGQWYYVDGISYPVSPTEIKLSRNGPCPCGSKKKFKNCHEKLF